MALPISVIICSHNPRSDYLTRVLEALRGQTLCRERWELLLIDNASGEPLSTRFDLGWHTHGRHVHEEQLGLTPARLRGIKEASGEVLVFVDDDNVLDPDYLEVTLRLSLAWPLLGAWGGSIQGEFEVNPPEWTKQYWGYLAIKECTRDTWSNLVSRNEAMPVGAGLCIRKNIAKRWTELVVDDPRRQLLGRKGASLSGAEDEDLARTACEMGMGTGRFTSLHLTHLIPQTRLDEEYLVRLVHDITCSGMLLRAMRGEREIRTCRAERIFRAYTRWRLDRRRRRFHDAITKGVDTAYRTAAIWKSQTMVNR
jgi:glycosyltransferase involved in cell wall biosynthesis